MDQAFLDAEMALFAEQAKDVDIIVTTALIRELFSFSSLSLKVFEGKADLVAGKKAPKLILREHVEAMKRKSTFHPTRILSGHWRCFRRFRA